MSEKGFYKYYKDLPGWGKGLLVIGAVGAGVATYFAGRGIYNSIKQKQLENEKGKTVKEAADEMVDLAAQGIMPSYSDTQYQDWANACFTSFDGWGSGDKGILHSDLEPIFMQMLNKADVLKLIQAYGVKTISSGQWNPAPDFTGDLSATMHDQMSNVQLKNINSILSENKIDFKF